MKTTISIHELIGLNRIIDSITKQEVQYPIRTAYKLIKAKEEIDSAVNYVLERIGKVCNTDIDFRDTSNTEDTIIGAIILQDIDLELPDINIEDVVSAENVKATASDVEVLMKVFGKKER